MTKIRATITASRSIARAAKGQAMTEFVFIAFVTFIVLFAAIQMAALGREASALGELNYQVTRWATNPTNNNIAGSNSPQCSDVMNLIKGSTVSPYSSISAIAAGYIGKLAQNGVACGTPPKGGIGVAMACITQGASTTTSCAVQRPAGTGVQITLTMDTSSAIFLSTSTTNPNFLGIPFPKTISSTQTMLTQ
jgi:hypothetical protein